MILNEKAKKEHIQIDRYRTRNPRFTCGSLLAPFDRLYFCLKGLFCPLGRTALTGSRKELFCRYKRKMARRLHPILLQGVSVQPGAHQGADEQGADAKATGH